MREKRDGKEFARTSNYFVQIRIYTACAASGKCLNLQESKYEEILHPSRRLETLLDQSFTILIKRPRKKKEKRVYDTLFY